MEGEELFSPYAASITFGKESMFKNIKQNITDLAYAAVNMAEKSIETTTGQEKKVMAIEYVVSMLPVFQPLKGLVIMLLSEFIDEAIEQSVKYMKEIKNA